MTQEPKYSIEEHKHRFASWAASRAASTSSICRFRVEDGIKILERCGFKPDTLENADKLPEHEKFDSWHEEHCEKAIILSKSEGSDPVSVAGNFTYGIAAKLINCYLKSKFVCGGDHEDRKVEVIHPPIDSLLLKALKNKYPDFKEFHEKELGKKPWSKFDKEDYKKVIEGIKKISNGNPLWKIEYHWQGYRNHE